MQNIKSPSDIMSGGLFCVQILQYIFTAKSGVFILKYNMLGLRLKTTKEKTTDNS